jgi:hypothetical protein
MEHGRLERDLDRNRLPLYGVDDALVVFGLRRILLGDVEGGANPRVPDQDPTPDEGDLFWVLHFDLEISEMLLAGNFFLQELSLCFSRSV